MSAGNGTSSSDENLYSRLTDKDGPARQIPVRGSERHTRPLVGNIMELDEPSVDRVAPGSVPAAPFTEVLAEIENARFAVAVAFKKVMLGTNAILHPELAELGIGPPEIDDVLETAKAVEAKVCGASGRNSTFYMRDLPPADEPVRLEADSRLVSYVSKGVRYLLPGKTSGNVGFGVAISCDDHRAIRLGESGRMSYPFMMSLGVTPFIAMPPDGMRAAARENEQRYHDKGGHGFNLPTFVRAYADFLAFAVQATPAAVGALLLCERHPRAAEELLIEHDKLTARISSAANYFVGYESTGARPTAAQRRSLRDSAISQSCGMGMIEAVVDWRSRCCKSPVLGEFAESYRDLRVDKIAEVLARRRP
jgi:hypothetical protein